MAVSNENSQTSPMSWKQAAEIIQTMYDESDPVIDDDELRIGETGRQALKLAHDAIMYRVPQPARLTTIFEGKNAELLKARGMKNFDTLKCPVCNNIIVVRGVNGISPQAFCNLCGQAIERG